MRLADVKPDLNKFFALFISRSGGGKSSAAVTWKKPLEIFDFDGRADGTIWTKSLMTEEEFGQIELTKFPLFTKFSTVENKLNVYWTMCEARQYNSVPRTILFDSVTNETRAMMSDALDVQVIRNGKSVDGIKGKQLGGLTVPSPGHYQYEAESTYQMFAFLQSLPINVIVTGHIVDRYGKAEGENNEYSESVVIGQKLSLRDKISENLLTFFNEVWEFKKEMNGDTPMHFVRFRGGLARTCFTQLPNGWVDITNKNLYKYFLEKVS